MLVNSLEGTIEAVNPAATRVLGWSEVELVGESMFDFVHPDDLEAAKKSILDIIQRGSSITVEIRCRHKDRSYRDIYWSGGPGDGKLIAVGRDVTEERAREAALAEAQEQLRQSQKVEAIGQLTGGVAHDFNNLLTVIRGSVDFLRKPGGSEDRRRRYIDAISDTVDLATRLTSQLLAFARRQSLNPETFDAGGNIVALKDMLRTLLGSRIRIVADVPAGPYPIHADRAQFDTAIVNIAVNARDAMGGEGTIRIAVKRVKNVPPVRSHGAIRGKHIAVAVSDAGSGIKAEYLDRIFEPFYTTKGVGEGTGLGLSQVFGFVKQSGGQVAVESEEGRGTTFTLYLPLALDVHEAMEHGSEVEGEEPHDKASVLIVEDNSQVGRFATQALAELGYTTILAPDAATALAELSSGGNRFDVVFTDVVMPGMSGIELAEEIKAHHPDLPVVLASGYSTVLAGEGTHGFDLLRKPYSTDDLARILRKAQARKRR